MYCTESCGWVGLIGYTVLQSFYSQKDCGHTPTYMYNVKGVCEHSGTCITGTVTISEYSIDLYIQVLSHTGHPYILITVNTQEYHLPPPPPLKRKKKHDNVSKCTVQYVQYACETASHTCTVHTCTVHVHTPKVRGDLQKCTCIGHRLHSPFLEGGGGGLCILIHNSKGTKGTCMYWVGKQ